MLPGLHSGLLLSRSQTVFIASFTGTSSATLSGVNAGDLLVCFSAQNSGAVPAIPSGFTSLNSGAPTYGFRSSYKVAAGGETSVSGGGTHVVVLQYRGVNLSAGASAIGSGTSGTPAYPALTLQDTSGLSLVAIAIAIFNAPSTPSGFVARGNDSQLYTFDIGPGVTSFAGATSTASSTNYVSASVEIKSS